MADGRRRTTKERGYGAKHRAEKERWRPTVDAGHADCAELICLEENDGRTRRIEPGADWDLAHGEGQVGYRGPAHARCNRSEAAKRGNRARAGVASRTLWWTP